MPCYSPSGNCDQTTCVIDNECAWKGVRMDPKEFWAGEGGDEYTKRNRVDWRRRIPFWDRIIGITGARSVFELGCNAGWNLSAIKRAYPDVRAVGVDINQSATLQANMIGLHVVPPCPIDPWPCYELTFTSGVLIHIQPELLEENMRRLINLSCDFVMAVEYESVVEQEVEYRGRSGLLWKRPYGRLYQDMGLQLIDYGIAQGFDRCHYWLLRKP